MHDNKLLGNYGYVTENIIQAMIKDNWLKKCYDNIIYIIIYKIYTMGEEGRDK